MSWRSSSTQILLQGIYFSYFLSICQLFFFNWVPCLFANFIKFVSHLFNFSNFFPRIASFIADKVYQFSSFLPSNSMLFLMFSWYIFTSLLYDFFFALACVGWSSLSNLTQPFLFYWGWLLPRLIYSGVFSHIVRPPSSFQKTKPSLISLKICQLVLVSCLFLLKLCGVAWELDFLRLSWMRLVFNIFSFIFLLVILT